MGGPQVIATALCGPWALSRAARRHETLAAFPVGVALVHRDHQSVLGALARSRDPPRTSDRPDSRAVHDGQLAVVGALIEHVTDDGLSGARPMPPPAMTMSLPFQSATGKALP